jgi:hypothetical protein
MASQCAQSATLLKVIVALLAGESEAVEVLLLLKAIQRQGRHDI